MFKIISKKKYEQLVEENEMLHKEIECMIAERNGIATNHVCHEVLCNDCVHVIKISRRFDLDVQTFCDLDRHCKDYVKKELTEGSNGE